MTNPNTSANWPKDAMLYALQKSMRAVQKCLGLTQLELAEHLGYSRIHIINLEGNRDGPRKAMTKDFAVRYVFFVNQYITFCRPWLFVPVMNLLRENVRKPEDAALFQWSSLAECWERHSPLHLPEEVDLSELFRYNWVSDFYLDISTISAEVFTKDKLKKTAAVMKENNHHGQHQSGYRFQRFIALESSMKELVEQANQNAEAAAVKDKIEQLANDGLIYLMPTSHPSQSSSRALAELLRLQLYYEHATLAVLTESQELAGLIFQLNNQCPLAIRIHVFRYNKEKDCIVEWFSPDLQSHPVTPASSPASAESVELGGCTYPLAANPYLKKE